MANEILTTLHPEQDPETNLYPNIKKDNIPNKSIDRLKLDDSINDLLNSIIELKPSGVDTSSNILAFTTNKGIYIGSDTGKWYYWSDTQYFEGGNFIESIDEYNVVSSTPITPNWTNNKYIWKDGSLGSLNDFSISDPISLNVGDVIEINCAGYLTNIAIISLYNETYKPVVVSYDNNKRKYTYVCTENCQVVLCGKTSNRGSVRVYTNYYIKSLCNIINFINENTHTITWSNTNINWVNGYYITNNGSKYTANNWSISDPISLNSGDIIYVNAQGYSTNVAIISIYENNTYKPVVISYDDKNHLFMYASPSNCQVVISTNNSNKQSKCRIFNSKLLSYSGNYTDLKFNDLKDQVLYPKYKMTNISLFEKIGVVGDSFASGYLYNNDNGNNYYNLSWVQILSRSSGIIGYNFTKGGLSTRTWLQDTNYGLSKLLSTDKCGLYILTLGINDIYISNYIGTISDINDEDPSLNPDTFYGNYGKIISNILSYSPKSKIIISTIKHPDSRINDINTAIIEIANHFNIPYISQPNNWYFKTSFFNTFDHGHPIAITYSGMANAITEMIEECMVDNRSYFDDYIGVGN